jgi:hypothetical protein
MWHSSLLAISAIVLLAPPSLPDDGVPASNASSCDAAPPRLPSFVHLQDGLEPIVQWTLAHSPTFRRQCRVLSSARRLSVRVDVKARPVGSYRRARGFFRETPSRGIAAAIEIYPGNDLPELLGHEFEHLIERLDGVDFDRASTTGLAQRMQDGAFETVRATETGRRVSGEVSDNAPDRVRGAAGRIFRALFRGRS